MPMRRHGETAAQKTAKTKASKATTNHHPARRHGSARPTKTAAIAPREIPQGVDSTDLEAGAETVHLTNLRKVFWPESGITKGALLQFYLDIAPVLLPHLVDRAMVMKRYPNGIAGPFFFMKRAPTPRPAWIDTCNIEHASGNVIDFPIIRDLASLLWVINLGCIDLNPWYARCDDVDRPDYVHFDLDPVKGATWAQIVETAAVVHAALDQLKVPSFLKTTGSRGCHIYVPIMRGPTQKEVWTVAKQMAITLAKLRPDLITAEYRIDKRPAKRVLVDYNQNAWGRTLASVYSVRPHPRACVSAPITWKELEQGIQIEDLRLDNMPARVKKLGDLWAGLLSPQKRARLETLYHAAD
ncbi:MAG: non-homologous end-joining DNA ligase [Candidatus Binatia bacterium]